jgi:hypothetical protein
MGNTDNLSIQLYTLRSLGELDRILDTVKQVSLDGRAKFWAVGFYSAQRNENYGWGPGVFETREQAQSCVDRYIAKGCPLPGTIDWFSP